MAWVGSDEFYKPLELVASEYKQETHDSIINELNKLADVVIKLKELVNQLEEYIADEEKP